jgi:hypothetical protein
MESANRRVNQALVGAAYSLGTNIEIIDMPGYSPLFNDYNMCLLSKEAIEELIPGVNYEIEQEFSTGSTDMGDLSTFMPVVHPYAAGGDGKSHGNDYQVKDPELACVMSAKWQVLMVKKLLENDAKRAYKILDEFKPIFPSAKAFLEYQDSINSSGDRIIYHEDGTATIIGAASKEPEAEEKV